MERSRARCPLARRAADHEHPHDEGGGKTAADFRHRAAHGGGQAGDQVLPDDEEGLDGAGRPGVILEQKIIVVELLAQRLVSDFVVAVVVGLVLQAAAHAPASASATRRVTRARPNEVATEIGAALSAVRAESGARSRVISG